jgi:5-methylcytosine-specific restriction endonuclease McrA
MDFFNAPQNRRLILEREDGRCFYCLKKINDSSAVFDHVARRSTGDETYRNVVASCRRCNNRKGESGGEDLLRVLFREGFITSGLLADRLAAIEKLRAGELRPPVV